MRRLTLVPLPEGRTALAGRVGGQPRYWDPETGAAVGEPLIGHQGPVATVPTPNRGTLLGTTTRVDWLQLWDPATHTKVGPPLRGHTEWVYALTAVPLPDGRSLLASGGKDQTVRLWDPETTSAVDVLTRSHRHDLGAARRTAARRPYAARFGLPRRHRTALGPYER